MKLVCLILVSFLYVQEALMDCRIVQTVREVDDYTCNSTQELREQGKPEMVHVSIYDDLSYPLISTMTFEKSPNLIMIVVKNSVSGVKPDAFFSLKNISRILISGNSYYEKVIDGTFRNLPVQYINLDFNSINSVEPGAFFNLPNLQTLRISSNNLRKIPAGIFNNLTAETLSLSRNRISIIENNAFMDLRNLKRLHLDGNLLSEFEPEKLMNHGPSLEILWLHNNSFTKIDQFTVKDLNNLRLVNLLGNKISEILPYTFNYLINLEVLVLSNNSLRALNADIFSKDHVSNLQKLYLGFNQLSFLTTKVLGKLSNLKHIEIGGNPWQCTCLDAIQTWIGDHEIQQTCDKDYYDGSRPACVVRDETPNACVYESNHQYYNIYKQAIENVPPSPPCLL